MRQQGTVVPSARWALVTAMWVLSASGCLASRAQGAPPPNRPAPAAPPSPRELASAQTLAGVFSRVAGRVSPSVVSLRVEVDAPAGLRGFPFRFFGPRFRMPEGRTPPVRRGRGSGIIVRSDGYILTNRHVVEQARRIEVQLRDERRFTAELVGTDEATDLAVVKIDADQLPVVRFADSDGVAVGEWALAIGSPFGLDYTLTVGVVSALGRAGLGTQEIEDYVQTDASINPGNSGGPLVNLRGEVIGINTMIVGRGTGIGFAIPAEQAKRVSRQLIDNGRVERAWIGVSFQEVTPELAQQFGLGDRRGALVSGVMPGGPAAEAGIQPGDVIQRVDGEAIDEGRDLLRLILRKPTGAQVALQLVREGQTRTLTLTTGSRPSQARAAQSSGRPTGSFGLQLQPLTPQLAAQMNMPGARGVLVAGVESGTPAERVGLRRGDVILRADRAPVTEVQQVQAALSDGTALLYIRRNEQYTYLVLSNR